MLKILIFFLMLFMLNFSIKPAFATQSMSLNEAISSAFVNNNEIRAFQNSLSVIDSDIGIARSQLMPKIKFDEIYENTNNPVEAFGLKLNQTNIRAADLELTTMNQPPPANNFLTAITLEQPVLDRKASISIGISKIDYSLQSYEYLRKREEIAKQVANAYFDVYTWTKKLQYTQKDVKEAKENLEFIKSKYKAKKALYSDILRASTFLNDTEETLVSAKKNLAVSKRALGLILGKVESIDTSKAPLPALSLKESGYYSNAALTRKDIKSLELKYENTKNKVKLAQAGYFPTIGVKGIYSLYDSQVPFGTEGHNYVALAYLNWYLFDGAKTRYEKLKAEAQVKENWEKLEGFKKKVAFEVFESYATVEEAKENLRLAKNALKTQEEGRTSVLKKYNTLELNLVDVLAAQANLNLARITYLTKENDYLDGLVNLGFVSGTILKELKFNCNE